MAAIGFVQWLGQGILGSLGASYSDRLMQKALRRASYKADNYVINTIGELANDAFESTYPGYMIKKTIAASPVLSPPEKKRQPGADSRQSRESRKRNFQKMLVSETDNHIGRICKQAFMQMAVTKFKVDTYSHFPCKTFVTPADVQNMTQITQGTGPNGVLGSRVLIESLKGQIFWSLQVGAGGSEVGRVIMFMTTANASMPVLADVLDNTNANALANYSDKVGKSIKILFDKTYCLDVSSNTASDKFIQEPFELDVRGHIIQWQGTWPNGTNQGIYILAYGGTGKGGVAVSWEIRYKDI